MSRDLISVKTRQEFREYFVSTSLATIDDAFRAEGLKADASYQPRVGGQRRALVEQYYHSVDWRRASGVGSVLRVFETVLVELDLQVSAGGANTSCAREQGIALRMWLMRDGIKEDGGRLVLPGQDAIHETLEGIDSPELQRQIDRIRLSIEADPGLAIGTAKELVETVCKTILLERGLEPGHDWDIGRLVKEARQTLSLLPSDIHDGAKGAESIKRLLNNLGSVLNSVAELRNLYGTGHGKHGKATGVHPRHARLAVGAAATLATFLLETHEARAQ
jgi:hypothetical protein